MAKEIYEQACLKVVFVGMEDSISSSSSVLSTDGGSNLPKVDEEIFNERKQDWIFLSE